MVFANLTSKKFNKSISYIYNTLSIICKKYNTKICKKLPIYIDAIHLHHIFII